MREHDIRKDLGPQRYRKYARLKPRSCEAREKPPVGTWRFGRKNEQNNHCSRLEYALCLGRTH